MMIGPGFLYPTPSLSAVPAGIPEVAVDETFRYKSRGGYSAINANVSGWVPVVSTSLPTVADGKIVINTIKCAVRIPVSASYIMMYPAITTGGSITTAPIDPFEFIVSEAGKESTLFFEIITVCRNTAGLFEFTMTVQLNGRVDTDIVAQYAFSTPAGWVAHITGANQAITLMAHTPSVIDIPVYIYNYTVTEVSDA